MLKSRGFTLLEVLMAILITAFGLLGLAGLMSKMQVAESEGLARSEAIALMSDMTERLYAASPSDTTAATAYTGGSTAGSTTTVGTGVSGYTPPCTGNGATLDLCEWHNALLGAAETRSSTKVGAMVGARGCVTLVTAPVAAPTCVAAAYRITVAWQGLVPSADMSTSNNVSNTINTCGQNQYSDEKYRRIVSQLITIGTPGCS